MNCLSSIKFERLKRGVLYETAKKHNYNKLILAQHAGKREAHRNSTLTDDLAESFLMSAFHNGFLRTMKACYMIE